MRIDPLLKKLRLKPGARVRLRAIDTDWSDNPGFSHLGKEDLKRRAREFLEERTTELAEAQELLWAADSHAVLVILQAMDAAGKDGVIKHVMSGVNPQGCQVHAFKQPTPDELDHTFLWRAMKVLPARGAITIFNRSYYEDVLVVKVHPEYVREARIPGADGRRLPRSFWQDRYDDINALERHLVRNGTTVIKFFLHVSRDEQKRRFLERLEEPDKLWKFSLGDLAERAHWDAYQGAYEEMLQHTGTADAPWYVIPADHKWIARAAVSAILTQRIRALSLEFPQPTRAQRLELEEARRNLQAE